MPVMPPLDPDQNKIPRGAKALKAHRERLKQFDFQRRTSTGAILRIVRPVKWSEDDMRVVYNVARKLRRAQDAARGQV